MNRLTALAAFSTLAVPLALAAPQLAWGQLAGSSHAPVGVTADQLQVENNQCLASWRGNAEALQDTSRLRADTIDVYSKVMGGAHTDGGTANCGVLERMEADGTVYYVTPTQVVKGDHATYSAETKTIVITGQVVAAQGKNVIAGTKLVINSDTGQATMVSNVTGRGKNGRVTGVFYPNAAAPGGAAPSDSPAAPVPPPPRRHGA